MYNNKKLILILILCISLVFIMLSGCSTQDKPTDTGQQNNETETTPNGTDSSGKPVTEIKKGVIVTGEALDVKEDANTKYKETITIAPSLVFTSMDVQNEPGGTAKSVFLMVFNTLVDYDTMKDEYIPGLAESWKQISDTVWEFKLRQGVKFHDGTEFTAKDVKFTIDRGKEMGASKSRFASISEVEIIDDYTVNLILFSPDNDIVYKLSEPNTVMLSANAFETLDENEANQVGTGPYMYKEWVQGDYLSLIRFDDYWGGTPKTKEIVIRSIPEASSRLIALQTGEIDICVDPPVIDLHYVAEDENLVLWQIPSSNIRHISVNMEVEPFTNKLVRQALMYAVDREALLALVYEGNATPHYGVMHPMSEFYIEADTPEYNPEKAKSLLAEAGYPDGFKTTIYCSAGTVQKAVATVMQAQLAEIGIEAEIQSLETATFNAGVAHGGTFPLAVDGWGGHTIGPDNALRTYFHSKGSSNRSNINDEYVDKLIDEAIAEKDYEKRKSLYAELQQYLIDNANWIPLAIEQINVGMNVNVQGFELPHGLFHHWYNLYIVEE
ncbi:MAG TPA: ABC transporter substrate-binding protein [Sedimentibacter sp.]|jgi:peptide/nickel transport system substrate-binding protein|nr:hypothetical protein [Clostridiales bacterium]HPY56410.1 ABC transporter substrate-binding protein [Sedimentibacter sp.]